MRARNFVFGAVGALALLVHSAPARAAIFTWNAGSGQTNTAGNWSPLGLPGALDDTHFWSGLPYTVFTAAPADQFSTLWARTGHPQFSCGDPLRVANAFQVDGGATASVIAGIVHAGIFSVGPGSLTITGNGTQAIATNTLVVSSFGNTNNSTSTVNVNGGASFSGGDFAIPNAAGATGILNVSGHPTSGLASSFHATGKLNVGPQGVGDVEVSAGASLLTDGVLLLGTSGVGRLHLFPGAGGTPPSFVANGSTVIGDNQVSGQAGGQGTLAIDSSNVDFKGAISLGDDDGGGPDTLRITGSTVLAEHGLTQSTSNTSILDLQSGSLRVLGFPFTDGYGLSVHQAVPFLIDGPGAGPTLTLFGGSDSIVTTTPLSLVVGHGGAGTLNIRGGTYEGHLAVMGDAVVADQSTAVGLVDIDSTGGLGIHGSLSVGPGNGTVHSRVFFTVYQWANVLSGPSTGGSLLLDFPLRVDYGGLAINGTKDSPSPGNATVSVTQGGLLLFPSTALQIWSGGHLFLGSNAIAQTDSGVVMGEIQMAGADFEALPDDSLPIHLRNGGILHGFGTVTHRFVLDDSTATIAVLASDTSGGSPSKIGTLAGGPGSLTVGDSTGTGSIVLGGMVRVEKDTLCFLNKGVLDLGPHVILSGGTLSVPHGGHVGVGGLVEGYGAIVGNVTIDGTVKAAGQLDVAGQINVPPGGELSAHGILSGSLSLGGHLDMGSTLAKLELVNSPTILSTNVLTLRIGSAAHGAQDTLVVDQPLSLNGTLDLRTWQADPPVAGDTLNLITAPSVTGNFSAVTLDGSAASSVQVIYEPTRVRLAVLSTTAVAPSPNPTMALRFAAAGTMVDPAFALDLPRAANVHLAIFNVGGRRIAELVNGRLEAGRYQFPFEGGTSGVYFGQAWIRDDAGTHLLSARLVRIR